MENKKNKIEDEDIKLWHKIFYNKVCSQIRTKEADIRAYQIEIDSYKALKDAVSDLNIDVDTCALSLESTYNYASNGVSCVDFDSNIEKIRTYGKNMQEISASLSGVMKEIDAKIKILEEKIRDVYAEIASLKASIGI